MAPNIVLKTTSGGGILPEKRPRSAAYRHGSILRPAASMLLVALALGLPTAASAGGSYEQVIVESIRVSEGSTYTLVVRPQPSDVSGYKDPYFGNCPKFTVHGTFSTLHSYSFPTRVTKENHRAALAHLQQAQQERKPVYFGWMGTGFVPVSATTPCVVRSRALELQSEEGKTFVLSHHNAT